MAGVMAPFINGLSHPTGSRLMTQSQARTRHEPLTSGVLGLGLGA